MRSVFRYPERSGINNQGGPRTMISINWKPVLAYSVNDEEMREPGGSVLRRMWEMYDMNFNRMVCERQRYFRSYKKRRRWTNSFWMETGRKRNDRNKRLGMEEEWTQWLRTTGRKQGLSDAVKYDGPAIKMTP